MSAFTQRELEYLGERRPERLGRIATVDEDGAPHVVPVGWRFNAERDSIDVGGRNLPATKKFKDIRRTGRAGDRGRRLHAATLARRYRGLIRNRCSATRSTEAPREPQAWASRVAIQSASPP